MAAGVITTSFARENYARATAGAEAIILVANMVFGDGGHDPTTEEVYTPLTSDTALGNQLLSVAVEQVTYPDATTARFTARIGIDELNGSSISEVGLADANGNLLTRKTFTPQPKTNENEFVFEWDEQW